MDVEALKDILKSMAKEIYNIFRLLSDENKKLKKRVEELERKVGE